MMSHEPDRSIKRLKKSPEVQRHLSEPNSKKALTSMDSQDMGQTQSPSAVKEVKGRIDLSAINMGVSQHKLHSRIEESYKKLPYKLLANDSADGMSDRHRSTATLQKSIYRTQRSLEQLLKTQPKDTNNSSFAKSRISSLDINKVFDKEDVVRNTVPYSALKKTKKENKQTKKRVINLSLQDDPLALNPTRKKHPALKFSDVYKLMGHARPQSGIADHHHAPAHERKTEFNPRKSIYVALQRPSTPPQSTKVKNLSPGVASLIEIVKKDKNHILCRLVEVLKSYQNIEEWASTLEGQRPQFSIFLMNKLGGQFSRSQMELIAELFFEPKKQQMKLTRELSPLHMLKVLFKQKEDMILMKAEKKQIAYLNETMQQDPMSLEVIVGLYFSPHFTHDNQQIELFGPATDIFLRMLTEAKAAYYGHLSNKCSKKLQQCVDRTKEIKYLAKQRDLKTFALVRAGMDDDAKFLAGIKRGLGVDYFKGHGIDRDRDVGEGITKEEQEFNNKIREMVDNMREICK